jgi:threonyl-tRNA synthetase
MRLLMFHCSKIGARDLRRSNRPKGVVSSQAGSKSFSDVLLVFVSVEKWDGDREIEEAGAAITAHLRMIRRDHVVVTPFAHLTVNLAESHRALSMVDGLEKILLRTTNRVDTLSFGFHKEFRFALSEVSIYGHPGSVAFRRIPRNSMAELVSMAEEVGPAEALQAISQLSADDTQNSPRPVGSVRSSPPRRRA